MASGFFDGSDFDNYKLICKSTESYEKYEQKKNTDKLILKISYNNDRLTLALAAVGPLHVSLDAEDGEQECSKIFNEHFFALVDENVTKKPKREKEE